ncbi:MAG: hypothetical protein PHD04_01445 [Candidatus Pacebacteria bacterium]|nr:hypothetical protein [Candidatus Paceibacterota bacterium]
MALFESKIKKTLRLSKYFFFVVAGTVLGFANVEKGDGKAIFSGLSIGPAVAHADIPTASVTGGFAAGSEGSDTPGTSDSDSDSDASSDSGSCCSSCSDDGSL